MHSREEVIETAMLAKMVGSHLMGVDQLTVDRPNNGGPANKIDINNFIAPLQGGRTVPQQHTAGATPDMLKAYQGLNELALQSVPDVSNNRPPVDIPNTNAQQPQSNIHTGSPVNYPQQPKVAIREENNLLVTRSDVDSIRNSLKGIDKSLVAIVKYLQNSKSKKND